ncbi:hypothetical protein BH09VER1_BH09VER1_49530 [soil metagenome]
MNVMREFLHALFESGHVSVASKLVAEDPEEIGSLVQDFDRVARLNLAVDAPGLDLEVGKWAAALLYRMSQLVVLRTIEAEEVAASFQVRCPSERSPATDYSADLFLRYLPDVHALAKRLAADDPLVAQLEKLAGDWPLSSVGMKDIARGRIDSFIHDASLRQLYVDRIIENKAFHLAQEPEMAEEIRVSCGVFPGLCDEISQTPATISVS